MKFLLATSLFVGVLAQLGWARGFPAPIEIELLGCYSPLPEPPEDLYILDLDYHQCMDAALGHRSLYFGHRESKRGLRCFIGMLFYLI